MIDDLLSRIKAYENRLQECWDRRAQETSEEEEDN